MDDNIYTVNKTDLLISGCGFNRGALEKFSTEDLTAYAFRMGGYKGPASTEDYVRYYLAMREVHVRQPVQGDYMDVFTSIRSGKPWTLAGFPEEALLTALQYMLDIQWDDSLGNRDTAAIQIVHEMELRFDDEGTPISDYLEKYADGEPITDVHNCYIIARGHRERQAVEQRVKEQREYETFSDLIHDAFGYDLPNFANRDNN